MPPQYQLTELQIAILRLLWERGEAMLAATYVIGSVVLSLAALVGGLAMMRSMS